MFVPRFEIQFARQHGHKMLNLQGLGHSMPHGMPGAPPASWRASKI
jgi:hypothetical protein